MGNHLDLWVGRVNRKQSNLDASGAGAAGDWFHHMARRRAARINSLRVMYIKRRSGISGRLFYWFNASLWRIFDQSLSLVTLAKKKRAPKSAQFSYSDT